MCFCFSMLTSSEFTPVHPGATAGMSLIGEHTLPP